MSGAISIPITFIGFLRHDSPQNAFVILGFIGLLVCASSALWKNHQFASEKEAALGEQKDKHVREMGQLQQELKLNREEIQSLKREIEKYDDQHLPLRIAETRYISDGLENIELLLPIVNPSKYSSATGVKVELLNIQPLPPLNNGASIPFPIQRFAKEKIDVIHPGSQLLFNVLKKIIDTGPWFKIEFSEPFPKPERGFTPDNSFKPEEDDTRQTGEMMSELKQYCFTIGVSADGRQEVKQIFQLSFSIHDKYFYDPSFSLI
jgi:hypothetical protein